MKEFNITGVCIPYMHYMVDIKGKIEEVKKLVEQGKYFAINRARQYGKTTVINQLYHTLKNEYLVLKISFEGLGEKAFSSESEFCESFINLISEELFFSAIDKGIIDNWGKNKSDLEKFEELSKKITELIYNIPKEVILIIDEMDKSSDNQLFLHFIGMLRNKYLKRSEGRDKTFKSVILVGVYDVKNLKLKLRPDAERKYNSPWNIAANFTVDLSFNPWEISTMLIEYEKDAGTGMDVDEISRLIYMYTSGYPFLVSRLCKAIEEELNRNWTKEGIEEAVKIMLMESNTLFDDLFKNLENDKELYFTIYDIVFNNREVLFSIDNPVIQKANMFSIIREENGKAVVHNKIFEIRIYNYLISKLQTSGASLSNYASSGQFIDEHGDLKIELILEKFQELMEEEYRDRTREFVEKEGRLLFLAFIKPIINGAGFYFVESETRDNMRLDVVITYNKKLYIIELKKWYGKEYEDKGYKQLADYMKAKKTNMGYIVMFDFRKTKKEYSRTWLDVNGKNIYEVVV